MTTATDRKTTGNTTIMFNSPLFGQNSVPPGLNSKTFTRKNTDFATKNKHDMIKLTCEL